jgi:hypothetical protein
MYKRKEICITIIISRKGIVNNPLVTCMSPSESCVPPLHISRTNMKELFDGKLSGITTSCHSSDQVNIFTQGCYHSISTAKPTDKPAALILDRHFSYT